MVILTARGNKIREEQHEDIQRVRPESNLFIAAIVGRFRDVFHTKTIDFWVS